LVEDNIPLVVDQNEYNDEQKRILICRHQYNIMLP